MVVNINGIKVAFLSYSTWFNRNLNRLTEKGQGLLNIYDIEKVKENITLPMGPGEADLVIVYSTGASTENTSISSETASDVKPKNWPPPEPII